MTTSEHTTTADVLMLPAASDLPNPEPSGPTSIQIGGASVPLDSLGPMIINSDGTLSRIANWAEMIDSERERTLRVLVARNKVRLAKETKGEQDPSQLSILIDSTDTSKS
ncbi:hypothetical protein HGRIS_007004 [Hohenbuehelia grisea]|uniref:Uncharacterized protein n=1 Tax=Hohenbuehelia grisea TaxID=104357 RepID=A0ABR3JBX1_9AGAR